MIYLLHLRRIHITTHSNNTILLQSLILSELFHRQHFLKGAHDINVVGVYVQEGGGGSEDLTSPEDGKVARAGGGIEADLADNGFKDGDRFGGAIGEGVADGDFLCVGL